jgi:hypothetical protein
MNCPFHRAPRGGVDPLRTADDALAIIDLARRLPAADETIVLPLDAQRRGSNIIVVSDTTSPDAVVGVVECLALVAAGAFLPELVVASVRPGRPVELADADRWLELDDVTRAHGVGLLEWFVLDGLDGGTGCPRDLLGAAARW